MTRRHYRSGFSLIELLIVVAIIAALIGVAVPYFQSNLAEAQVTKAKQDLDTIRNAINLYESKYHAITGENLNQLLGQTMQDIPNDPWGTGYYLDANLGIIWTYGSDGQPGGTGADADQVSKYKPPLQIRKAVYTGSFGPPTGSNTITLIFTKPFQKKAPAAGDFILVRNASSPSLVTTGTGANKDVKYTLASIGFTVSPVTPGGKTDPDNGIVFLTGGGSNSDAQTVTATMAIDCNASAAGDILINPVNHVFHGGTLTGTLEASPYKDMPQMSPAMEAGAQPCDNGIGALIEKQ